MESWNNGFRHLVGHSNPSLWTVINCIMKDNADTETEAYRTVNDIATSSKRRKKCRPTSEETEEAVPASCQLREDGRRISSCDWEVCASTLNVQLLGPVVTVVYFCMNYFYYYYLLLDFVYLFISKDVLVCELCVCMTLRTFLNEINIWK